MFTLWCLILLAATGAWAQEYRLSKDVIPQSYDIAIKPYLRSTDGAKQFTFDGEVNITLHAIEANVKIITVHKDYIDILDTILYDGQGNMIQRIPTGELLYESTTDKLGIPLQMSLTANTSYILYFNYTGQIRSGLAGVFRGTYDDVNWYAITQLQRIDARTAFPCFDEPQLKATFRMRITRPKEYVSFFNTRLMSTSGESDGWYTDYFDTTPPMSTYLVAFLVGDFDVQGDNDFKMIMNSKVSNKTQYSHEVALKTLAAYDAYTQIPYKTLGNTLMQKAGSIRFPHNGMENWGLVIYLDTVLSHEPGYTDGWSNKEYTVTILVHETAHMWFGNSVTFKWWSYFWLNEAFARYYQYYLAHEIYPEFELDKQFVVNQVHLIFATDATNGTQPMTSPEAIINSPSEVASKFSSITYAKGAAIVRMICILMGKEKFDLATREYLKENHLKSTEPEDLFIHWKRHWPEHNVDVNQLLRDWTEQPGFPLIRISTTPSGQYQVKQERFLLDPEDGSDKSIKYTTPITYTTNRERNFEDLTPKFYLNKSLNDYEFGDSKEDEWIVLNLQQSNFHRVFYETSLLEKLRKAFMASNHSDIHIINRAHMVDDLFTYGRIGLLGYDVIFEFMEYLATEIEYLPWNPAFKSFDTISQRFTLQQHDQFGEYLFDIMAEVYRKLGFDYESPNTVLDIYNRNKVVTWLCKYHHRDCNEKAQYHFKSMTSTSVPADFQETLYCAACRDATFDVYSSLAKMYEAQTFKTQKEKILRAMGCTRHFVDNHYEFILSDKVPQDSVASAISSLYTQTPENVGPVYYAVTESVEFLTDKLGSWSSTASVISGIANYFTTQNQLDEFKDFIADKGYLFGASISTLVNAVKTVENNLAWSEKHLGRLLQYLDQRNGATTIKVFSFLGPLLTLILLKFL
ncbi:membrane alanyl aminopeptidase [Haematobia irritans]|uniref:membrane alanyl aminopeptidase n=1 Tax=Haematobia irritans TaxID=7368 RepID=UPI003F508C40